MNNGGNGNNKVPTFAHVNNTGQYNNNYTSNTRNQQQNKQQQQFITIK